MIWLPANIYHLKARYRMHTDLILYMHDIPNTLINGHRQSEQVWVSWRVDTVKTFIYWLAKELMQVERYHIITTCTQIQKLAKQTVDYNYIDIVSIQSPSYIMQDLQLIKAHLQTFLWCEELMLRATTRLRDCTEHRAYKTYRKVKGPCRCY